MIYQILTVIGFRLVQNECVETLGRIDSKIDSLDGKFDAIQRR